MKLEEGTIIAAHCDDEALGCYKLFEDGLVNKVVIVTDSSSQVTSPFISTIDYIATRKQETRKFCAEFKVGEIAYLNFPDGLLSSIFSSELDNLIDFLEKTIRMSNAVYFHSILDSHPDHRFINGICHRIINDIRTNKLKYNSQTNKLKFAYEYCVGSIPPKSTPISKSEWEKRYGFFRSYYESQYTRLRKSGYPMHTCLHNYYKEIAI